VALCKCGQKNPIPKAGVPATPQPVAPQPVAPAAAAPQAPQFAPIPVEVAAPAGGDDDLSLQDLDQETGAKEDPPQPCPACEKLLPAGEIVCHHCGFVAGEGLATKDKRIIGNKPRSMSWGGKHPSELTAMDFIKMAVSAQVFSAMVMLILRTIFACLLVFFVAIGLSLALGLVAAFLPPIGAIILQLAFVVFLASLFWGTIMKEPFAICQAACFGYDAPKVNDWPTLKTGFFFVLTSWIPAIAAFMTSLSGNTVASVAVYWLAALFIVPMTFLSIAQSGGEWSGFNPVRIFAWLGKLIVPYMGIAGLIFAELTLVAGLGYIGVTSIDLDFTQRPIDWTKFGMLAGVFVIVSILMLHPFVYGAAMLGMLYRKNERQMMK